MSSRRVAVAALLVSLGTAATATAQTDGVQDLTLPVQDLTYGVSSLDNSISTLESAKETRVTLAADVLFRFNRASLGSKAQSRIAETVEIIRRRKPDQIRVTGYTDAKGSDAYNLTLSRRRAESVAGALRDELGAGTPAIRTAGRGEADPVAPNVKEDGSDNPKGRARNRRVTVAF